MVERGTEIVIKTIFYNSLTYTKSLGPQLIIIDPSETASWSQNLEHFWTVFIPVHPFELDLQPTQNSNNKQKINMQILNLYKLKNIFFILHLSTII